MVVWEGAEFKKLCICKKSESQLHNMDLPECTTTHTHTQALRAIDAGTADVITPR